MPVSLADDLVLGFFGDRVYLHLFDRPGGRPHAELDLRTLECRARCAGCRAYPVPVAEEQLAVRSDIDDEDHLVLEILLLRYQNAHIISADKPCFDRKHMDKRSGVDLETEVTRFDIKGALHCGYER